MRLPEEKLLRPLVNWAMISNGRDGGKACFGLIWDWFGLDLGMKVLLERCVSWVAMVRIVAIAASASSPSASFPSSSAAFDLGGVLRQWYASRDSLSGHRLICPLIHNCETICVTTVTLCNYFHLLQKTQQDQRVDPANQMMSIIRQKHSDSTLAPLSFTLWDFEEHFFCLLLSIENGERGEDESPIMEHYLLVSAREVVTNWKGLKSSYMYFESNGAPVSW